MAIFPSNIPLLSFDLLQENVTEVQNWSNFGRLADTPICLKWPALWGPKYTSWQFISLNGPPFNMDFVLEIEEIFSKRSSPGRLADPLFAKTAHNLGPQILILTIFS